MQLEPTVTAPSFEHERLAYYCWFLRVNGHVYKAFRDVADTYRAQAPDRQLSADMLCHVVRYQMGLKADGDVFAINNVVTPMLARLYKLERPDANFDTRKSWLDTLSEADWATLLAAFEPLRLTPEQPNRTGWVKQHERGVAHLALGRSTACGLGVKIEATLLPAQKVEQLDPRRTCPACLRAWKKGVRPEGHA